MQSTKNQVCLLIPLHGLDNQREEKWMLSHGNGELSLYLSCLIVITNQLMGIMDDFAPQ